MDKMKKLNARLEELIERNEAIKANMESGSPLYKKDELDFLRGEISGLRVALRTAVFIVREG